MLCEPISSYNGEKEVDKLTINSLINIQKLTTNIEKFLVCQQCTQYYSPQIKIEEERYHFNFFSYLEYYFELSSVDQNKLMR